MLISPTVSRLLFSLRDEPCVFCFFFFFFYFTEIIFYRLLWYEFQCASERKKGFCAFVLSFLLFTYNFTIKPQNNSKINKIQIRKKIYICSKRKLGSMWNERRYANGTLSPRLHELYHTQKKLNWGLKILNENCFFILLFFIIFFVVELFGVFFFANQLNALNLNNCSKTVLASHVYKCSIYFLLV